MFVDESKIKKVIFDVQYPEQRSAVQLQNKIISDFNSRIHRILDVKLSKFTENANLFIDTLELDLGTLSKDAAENNLPELFEQALDEYLYNLSLKIASGELPDGIEYQSVTHLVFNYIHSFLTTGIIPWNLQKLGEEKDIISWIEFLNEQDNELGEKVAALFASKSVRKRFIPYITTSNKEKVYRIVFGNAVSNRIIKAEQFIRSVYTRINISIPIVDTPVLHFALFLGSNSFTGIQADMTIEELADEYFDFIFTRVQRHIPKLLSVFVGITERANVQGEDIAFIKTIENKYLSYYQEVYSYQFYSERLGEIQESTPGIFTKYLTINIPDYIEPVTQITDRLISVLVDLFSKESKEKVSNVIRAIVIESINNIKLPDDTKVWKEFLEEQLFSVFGMGPQKEISDIIDTELVQIEDSVVVEKKAQGIKLQELKLIDGGEEYTIRVQQVIEYLSILSKYGVQVFEKIFQEPKRSLEKIIVWFSSEHEHFFQQALRKFHQNISPITLWRINQELAEDVSRLLNPTDYKSPGLGKVLFQEVFLKGSISSSDADNIGVVEIRGALKQYLKEDISDVERFLEEKGDGQAQTFLPYLEKLLEQTEVGLLIETLKKKDVFIFYEKYSKILGDKTLREKITDKEAKPDTEKGLEPETGTEERKGVGQDEDKGIELSDEEKEVLERIQTLSDLQKLQFLLPLLFERGITEKQKTELAESTSRLIQQKNTDFAIYLISLEKSKADTIKSLLSAGEQTKIEQLIRSFEFKHGPKKAAELIEEGIEEGEDKPFRRIVGEEIYISNAGMVILSPYISMLFKRMELVEDKEFVSDKAQIKGIQLLQYIINKSTSPEDPELSLNKILVGLEPGDIIEEFQDVSDEEKEMCDGLIDAIIKNWSVLKSTSRDNIRASFFMRNGKLTFDGANWILKVEQKSIDVLIDKMPWSFSMIKLPWMKYPLMTEWR